MIKHISIKNNQSISLHDIPVLKYDDFLAHNTSLLKEEHHHCVNYFGFPQERKLRLICCIANDNEHTILVSSSLINLDSTLPSFTHHHLSFHIFEREIHENYGIRYSDHPWLKPIRFSHDRYDRNSKIENYPFYKIDSEELHEVGVGPIHAGIIEPGHFRFICNGEQIIHLEIQLGFQHRGIEKLFLEKKKLLQRTILAESIAGDTVVGHTTAFVNLWESLCGFKVGNDLMFSRTLALELERIAIHTGDLSAICNDIAYQLGSAVFGRLRTPVINFFQIWCGNRMAKGLVRAGKNNFPFSKELGNRLLHLFEQYEPDFKEMYAEFKTLPSVLARLEKTGIVTKEQAYSIGAVGMSARMSGIVRDIRMTHPHDLYPQLHHKPILKHHGDVYSRTQIRKEEILQSIDYIKTLLKNIPEEDKSSQKLKSPSANAFAISLTEGWRGEICHCAITDEKGEIAHYKIKDPSMHNWLALALSVRNNEISDFPLCNKSFNLSYCGHDL
ncbi:MAG: NADH-quinone oxidoreductase subunit C [Thermoflavifilum sp.]|nr:NADH-quinone oxidoreductase subunit C [Thermoflavifilum sp.]